MPRRFPLNAKDSSRFKNVDFVVGSRSDLAPLIKALDSKASEPTTLRGGGLNWAIFNLFETSRNADHVIRKFATLVLELPRGPRRIWNEAVVRDFDVGVAATQELSSQVVLSAESAALAAKLSARIVVTIYPYRQDDDEWFEKKRVRR